MAVISFIAAIGKLFRKQKTGWAMPIMGFLGASALAAGSIVVLAVFVFSHREEITQRVASEGQSVLATAVEAGTTGLGEGIDGTVKHFENRQVAELAKSAEEMTVEVLSVDGAQVEVGIRNSGTHAVKLRDLIENGLLLCVDSGGFDHFFQLPDEAQPLIPPGSMTRHRLQTKMPDSASVKAVKLVGHEPVLAPSFGKSDR